ncbi:hypothetical protein F53441_14055 [Fusarium austroafricanum]|uniref:PA14 domain-containing protein n=1 Tax=Fusarium austroafricanum TaxID=2364996 RepID=A0A8H4NGT9_9HYPO|nr:hypothetical protein F53441_14055 [Fusarium austroafricanum]
MQSFLTFAGLAFANFAAAGPCKPRPTTTAVSSIESFSSTGSATVISSVVSSVSTDHPEPTVSETSAVSSVTVQETTTADETTAEKTTAGETTTVETSAAQTTTAEITASSTYAESSSGTETLTTETAEPTADQSCDNGGLDYAIYEHEFYNSDAPHFSSLDVGYFHTAEPTFEGVTSRIGIQPGTDWNKPFTIYEGSPEQMWQYKAVDHRGFLYAPETGTYEVTVPNSDEITLVWFGEKAVNSWTRANADVEQDYPGGTSKTFTIDLEAGTYTPFRLLWANAQGELNFIAEVKAPGGNVIVNGDGSDNKYFVRRACDDSTPTFPAFSEGG